MSPHPYTEDQLVEQPAIALLAELGWTTVTALDEVLGLQGTFGRETRSDVVLAAQVRYSRGVALWSAGRRAEGRAEVAASLAEMPEGRPELRKIIQDWLDGHR